MTQQLQKLVGPQLLLGGRPQQGQGAAQVGQFGVQFGGAEVALARHHLGKTLAALAFLHRIGRQHRLAALAPGAAGREQLGQGGAEAGGLAFGDAQVEGGGGLAQPHEDLKQLRGPQGLAVIGAQGQGRGLQGHQQLGLVLQLAG